MSANRQNTMAGVFLLVAIAAAPTSAEPQAPRGEAPFWDDYWQGLMSLREARWAEAERRIIAGPTSLIASAKGRRLSPGSGFRHAEVTGRAANCQLVATPIEL